MITELDVANAALVKIQAKPLSALDENNERALAVRECWEMSLSSFLAEFDWSFATRTALLARFPGGEHDPAPYRHAYGLPDGLVKVLTVFGFRPGGRDPFSAIVEPDYEVRISGPDRRANRILCCDWDAPTLKYVSSDATFDLYSPPALEALTFRLALSLDMQLHAGANAGNVSELYAAAKENAVLAEARTTERRKLLGTYTEARTGTPSAARRGGKP